MRFAILPALLTAAGLIGCGTTSPPAVPAAAVDSKYVLTEAPAGAKPVIDVRKDAKDGDDVVITGRIGGDVDPWVKGRAAFLIVDPSLEPCTEGCPTPWDYCCDTDRLAESKATIKFVDDAGDTLPTDARELLGIKELQHVTIRGQAKRDDAGNLTVLASAIYVKP